jgi:hypothetical protein
MTPRLASLGEKTRPLVSGIGPPALPLTGAKLGSRRRVASQERQPSFRCTDRHGTGTMSPSGRPNERNRSFSAGSGTTSVLSTPMPILAFCAGMAGANEEYPFGDEVAMFKVGGKMFALVMLEGEPS